jgi:hypothetical protein
LDRVEALVATVLGKCAGEKRFINTCAQQTLKAALSHGPYLPVLMGVLPVVNARNFEIAALAVESIDTIFKRVATEEPLASFVIEHEGVFTSVLRAMVTGINCRNPAGKSSARAALRRIREGISAEVRALVCTMVQLTSPS